MIDKVVEVKEVKQKLEISDKGVEVIVKFEGFSSKPYFCSGGACTIGFGSTKYLDGTAVKMSDKPISHAEGLKLLHLTLKDYEKAVSDKVKVSLTQNQFDALVSFVYNVGERNFTNSTLLAKLNSNRYSEVPRELLKWNRAGGKVLEGLTRRRKEEGALFSS